MNGFQFRDTVVQERQASDEDNLPTQPRSRPMNLLGAR